MLGWLSDRILKVINYVPELFLAEDDPHFDVLRWWFVFVVAVCLLFVIIRVRRALRNRAVNPH